jgi:acyl-CoA thioesterase FadM
MPEIPVLTFDTSTLGPEHLNAAGLLSTGGLACIFDKQSDNFLDYLGIGEASARSTNVTTFVVASTSTNHEPPWSADVVRVWTDILKVGGKSFRYVHKLRNAAGGPVIGEMEIVSVCVDLSTGETIAIPAEALRRLERIATG